MQTLNIHEAKTHCSRLAERAAKVGHPLVKVLAPPTGEGGATQQLGFLTGETRVPGDFDRMGQDVIEALFTKGGQ